MPASEKPLNIDIPVKLSDVKVVFSIEALEFEGDLPASIFHLAFARKISEIQTKSPLGIRSEVPGEGVSKTLGSASRDRATSREFPQNSENFFLSSHVHAFVAGATARQRASRPDPKIRLTALARLTPPPCR
jgi:hypothetical protein